IKSTFTPGDAARGTNQPQPGAAQPHGRELPTAQTPFRSTSPNGQPVYAGPPAYRWYGWGSVTPGAHPYAPPGYSPKPSANWYSIAGATPGAFPVTVAESPRPAMGMEPPEYTGMPSVQHQPPVYTQNPAPVVVAPHARRPPAVAPVGSPEPPRVAI